MSFEKHKRKVVEVDYGDSGQWIAYYPCDMELGQIARSFLGEPLAGFVERVVKKCSDSTKVILSDSAFLVLDLENIPQKRHLLQHWAKELNK